MRFLVFQLHAPLSSWGETAVGEYRGSHNYPGQSALLGLLAAALGIRREDDAAHLHLQKTYGLAIGVQSEGQLLRDYHTAQVPGRSDLKGRPHATRKHELDVPKRDLNTILSSRDYRQGASYLVAVQPKDETKNDLESLASALRTPRFTLYLGRKSCPPAMPLHPVVFDASSAFEAMQLYRTALKTLCESLKDRRGRAMLEGPGELIRLVWAEGVTAGVEADLSVPRKDRIIRRRAWQFGDRLEHSALLINGSGG